MPASTPVLTRPPAPSDAVPLPRRLRVLVADDNHDAADTLAAVLQMSGIEPEVCYDGRAAVAAAAWFRPDVCLLDLEMPGLGGDEVAARLLDLAGGEPVLFIAVTARADEEARRRTRETGFDLHLVKPEDPADLLAVMADADWWLDRPGA